jgi:transcriptional regulator with XRE-family HTH domain
MRRRPGDPNPMLVQRRKARGWSQSRLARELTREAARQGIHLPRVDTLVTEISRWENGKHEPDEVYRRLLCAVLEATESELDLIDLPTPVKRRRFLKVTVAASTGAVLESAAILESFGDQDLWQLARAMRASNVDAKMLDLMEMSVLRAHQVYASLAPIELFPRVQGRLLTVAELLQQPQPLAVRRRLCVIAGHLAGLRAWLTFDLGDHRAALAAYDQALEPAEEAGDDALCGWILGGKSLIPSYAGDPKAALEMVGRGQTYAARSSNLTCQAWLAALEARAYAGMDNTQDYRKAQDRANAVVNETQLAERRHGMDFDGNELSLSYYEGTSLATLRESRASQPVLQEALRVQGSGHLKAQSIVRIALATTYVQQSEIEEACRLAGKALEIPPEQRIGPIAQRVSDLRAQLAPWRTTAAVKDLDEQLAELRMTG